MVNQSIILWEDVPDQLSPSLQMFSSTSKDTKYPLSPVDIYDKQNSKQNLWILQKKQIDSFEKYKNGFCGKEWLLELSLKFWRTIGNYYGNR